MSPKGKAVETVEEEGEEEAITLDMTKAKTFSPLPVEKNPYLMSVSGWKPGNTANGKKIDVEWTVLAPKDFADRKVTESYSLENEFSLGHLQSELLALGFPEEQVKGKGFKLPKAEDIIGLQATVWVGIRKDKTGNYGDRNGINRLALSSAYKPVTGTGI